MTSLVLDCSVTISWIIQDESNTLASTLLELVTQQGAIVPSIWPLEVGNVLLRAERTKRITSIQRHVAIHALSELLITIDTFTDRYAFLETMELAERHHLTLYDASYLELALRMNIPIATFDKQLQEAAKQNNVVVMMT